MSAIFKLTYGLFVLSAKDGDKDNGCIINTALQVTDSPLQLSITLNKASGSAQSGAGDRLHLSQVRAQGGGRKERAVPGDRPGPDQAAGTAQIHG